MFGITHDRNRPKTVKHFLIKSEMKCACGVFDNLTDHFNTIKRANNRLRDRKNNMYRHIPQILDNDTWDKKFKVFSEDPAGFSPSNPMYSWAKNHVNSPVEDRRMLIRSVRQGTSLPKNSSKTFNYPRGWDESFEKFKGWVAENGRMPTRENDSAMYWFCDRTRRYIKSGDRLTSERVSKFKREVVRAKYGF